MDALLEAALRLAAPLLLAALGELLVERAGVVNIGVEGTMLCGAFAGFAAAAASGSPVAGAAAAIAAGAAVGALFAAFAVVRGADQIVVGAAVNLLALGSTALAARALYGGAPPSAPVLPAAAAPAVAIGLVPLLAWFLSGTRRGLRLRAVGERARAADAEGVSVSGVRIAAAIAGGALAGLAGAALSISQSNTFTEGMTAGRGFIALAVVIFGRWRPGGVLLAALFFGAAMALQPRLQASGSAIPYQASLMLPYVVTLLVLAFASGRARAPGDLGRPYRRE
jgi:simple sugar transport system permease protein